MVEWIPGYNGGHEQTFNIQYRIVNESTWITQKIPQYNKQTYILSELQSNTWYELRMFARNRYDRSSVTDIQIISTVPSVEKGISSRVSVFCFLTFFILRGVSDINFSNVHPSVCHIFCFLLNNLCSSLANLYTRSTWYI